jgi:hypothetical protein
MGGWRPFLSQCEIYCSKRCPAPQIGVGWKNADEGSTSTNHVAISEKRNYTVRIWPMKDGVFPVTQLT